jgi:hypothetical protein
LLRIKERNSPQIYADFVSLMKADKAGINVVKLVEEQNI